MSGFFNFFGISDSKISLANIAALPQQTQMLLAYCLVQGNPELSLMTGDRDADDMISAGWLGKVTNMTSGVLSFKFQPDTWTRLKSLRPEFLAKIPLTEIQYYAKSKSAGYPWTW
jgi:hypothetical protein